VEESAFVESRFVFILFFVHFTYFCLGQKMDALRAGKEHFIAPKKMSQMEMADAKDLLASTYVSGELIARPTIKAAWPGSKL
jgi:hypothetical protein